MFCPKCGTKNENGAQFCTQCGADLAAMKMTVESARPSTQVASKHSPWLWAIGLGILVVVLGLCVCGGGLLAWRTTQRSEKAQPAISARSKPTPTTEATPSPTPGPAQVRVGELATTDRWAISVTEVKSNPMSGILGSFTRFAVSYRLKNITDRSQFYELGSLPLQLLDYQGYTIGAERNVIFSLPMPVIVPPGLMFRDGVTLDASEQGYQVGKVVIDKSFGGRQVTFDMTGEATTSSLLSEEKTHKVGEVVSFGAIDIQLLSGQPVELGFENSGSSAQKIELKGAPWTSLDTADVWTGATRVIYPLLINKEGYLCSTRRDVLLGQIQADQKGRGKLIFDCSSSYLREGLRLWLFDANGNVAVFDLGR